MGDIGRRRRRARTRRPCPPCRTFRLRSVGRGAVCARERKRRSVCATKGNRDDAEQRFGPSADLEGALSVPGEMPGRREDSGPPSSIFTEESAYRRRPRGEWGKRHRPTGTLGRCRSPNPRSRPALSTHLPLTSRNQSSGSGPRFPPIARDTLRQAAQTMVERDLTASSRWRRCDAVET